MATHAVRSRLIQAELHHLSFFDLLGQETDRGLRDMKAIDSLLNNEFNLYPPEVIKRKTTEFKQKQLDRRNAYRRAEMALEAIYDDVKSQKEITPAQENAIQTALDTFHQASCVEVYRAWEITDGCTVAYYATPPPLVIDLVKLLSDPYRWRKSIMLSEDGKENREDWQQKEYWYELPDMELHEGFAAR